MKTGSETLTSEQKQQALLSPTSIFDDPMEVIGAGNLAREEKLKILKRWELDARALQRASDESMSGGEFPPLDAVNEALALLDPANSTPDNFGKAPTKI